MDPIDRVFLQEFRTQKITSHCVFIDNYSLTYSLALLKKLIK
jgi:hypothetical protein